MFFGHRGFFCSISSLPLLSFFAFLLTGCTLSTTAPDAPITGAALHGSVYGGQQPVVGAHIYLMAATVSGVGSAGYGLASTSLLSAASTGHSDAIGAYVLTDSSGAFRLDAGSGSSTYDYTCPSASTQVYLYSAGGNPGGGTNSAAAFMAALGSCSTLNSSQTIQMNELTTVAAAYSLAGFATDPLHISIPQYASAATQLTNTTDALALTDLQNAFATAAILVSNTTGTARTSTVGGNGTLPSTQINTLGDVLAPCVNSTGPTSTNCVTLFNNALSAGGTGAAPTDTATAAMNIAHNPYVSETVMSNLFFLQTAYPAPFIPADSSVPTDWTLGITYAGGGLNTGFGIAIDASGNVWVANFNPSSISKFSPSGAALSSSSGFVGGGLSEPTGIAIDTSGNAWVSNTNANDISKFSPSGTPLSSTGYTGGGLNGAYAIAIDGSGNAWAANFNSASLSEFSSSGTAISTSAGYRGGGLGNAAGIAIDASGNAWVANLNSGNISKFSSSGIPISNSFGYTGGGLNGEYGIAIDNSGNVWAANFAANSISKLSSTGTPISGSNGYRGAGIAQPYGIAIDGSGNVWVANAGSQFILSVNSVSELSNSGTAISPPFISSTRQGGYNGSGGISSPNAVAVDGSGNVWTANSNNTITELVGAATPVVTPIAASLIAPYSAPASKP